jgi:hypothetical protein
VRDRRLVGVVRGRVGWDLKGLIHATSTALPITRVQFPMRTETWLTPIRKFEVAGRKAARRALSAARPQPKVAGNPLAAAPSTPGHSRAEGGASRRAVLPRMAGRELEA